MTHLNKLNYRQKAIMGEFMKDHPNLAKSIIPNCAQGKATAIRLWEDLSAKLNAAGPPMNDAKMWRKAVIDYDTALNVPFNTNVAIRTISHVIFFRTIAVQFTEYLIRPQNSLKSEGVDSNYLMIWDGITRMGADLSSYVGIITHPDKDGKLLHSVIHKSERKLLQKTKSRLVR